MVDEIPLLLVARLLDLVEVQSVADAALRGRVALVPLEDPPLSREKHALVVHAPGLPEPIVLNAVPAGDETGGLHPLKLSPTRNEQIPMLQKLVGPQKRTTRPPPRSVRPRATKPPARATKPPPSRGSRPDRDERTLPDARADPLLGFVIANGKYEIESAIGVGAYGKVYRGRHRTLDRPVAIKILQALMERDQDFASRFQREALAASKLDHPNVAQVLDYGEEPDGMLYIVMELLEGKTLRDALNHSRPLSLKRIVELMNQLTGALAAAHDAGIIHRDIKPENVVLVRRKNDDGDMKELLKVCDFGIAAVQKVDVDGAPEYLSSGGTSVTGTPEYMAPEVARGERVDARSDIYACGVLLYELATGVVPFTGATPVAILVAHVSDAPRPPSEVNPKIDKRLELVILRALSKNPGARQDNVRELRADLRALLGKSGEMRAGLKSTVAPPIPREEDEDATPTPALVRLPAELAEPTLTLPPQRAPAFPQSPSSPRKSPVTLPPPTLDEDETTPPQRSMDEPPAAVVLDANASPETKSAPPSADAGPPPEPLTDPTVGFSEFLGAVTAAVARTTYYERAHPEFARSLAQLSAVMGQPLARRSEITFARRDRDSHELVVMTGVGENMDLVKAAPGGVGSGCAQRLGEVFSRRGLVSLTFKEGVDERELGDAIELLSGPEIPPNDLHTEFASRGLTRVSILFVSDMLGRERRLPWQVMLCVSRIARDLEAVPKMVRGADPERRRKLRTALTSDVMRTLKTPEQVKLLLMNWDLFSERVGAGAELPAIEIPVLLVGSLAHPMLLRTAGLLLAEMERQATGASPAALVAPSAGTSVRQLMQIVGARFVRERTIESDEVLRELHSRAVLSFPELPEDVQLWVLAEQQAEQLAIDPEPILRELDSVYDVARYARDAATLARAMRVLARRAAVGPLFAIVVRLQQRHARGAPPGDDTREGLAARALDSIADADVLDPVAVLLLSGAGATRDPAQGILVGCGRAGARALCNVRARGGELVRMRFVEAMKEIGPPAVVPLGSLVERLVGTPPGEDDAALAEDVLRSLPELSDERLGMLVAQLLRHKSPSVRRAAATALASPWGTKARSVLFGVLDDGDESVRVAALTGLRKVGAIDIDVVRRAEKFLDGTAPGGDNTCAVAAALLADAIPEARAEAIAVLTTALAPRARGVVARLTGAAPLPREAPMVVETLARSLLAIGGTKGRDAVKKRASKSPVDVQRRLNALLQGT